MKFRKRLKIAPGLYLNVSTRGASWSVGVPGAMINFGGRNGAKVTVGLPGSGISFTHNLSGNTKGNQSHSPLDSDPHSFDNTKRNHPTIYDSSVTSIVSADIEAISDMGMTELVDVINQTEATRQEISKSLSLLYKKKSVIDKKTKFYGIVGIRSIFRKKLDSLISDSRATNAEIEIGLSNLENTGVYFDWGGDEKIISRYRLLSQSFSQLISSEKIWDILSYRQTDKFRQRTQADKEVSREDVKFSMGRPNCLPASKNDEFKKVPHLGNRNGGDIYIFPGFILIESDNKFAAVSISDLDLNYNRTRFAETEGVPKDSLIDGNTWRYANKNGGPDRRFNDNYKIPWAVYGTLTLRFTTLLHEEYMISNEATARNFAEHLNALIEYTKNTL